MEMQTSWIGLMESASEFDQNQINIYKKSKIITLGRFGMLKGNQIKTI